MWLEAIAHDVSTVAMFYPPAPLLCPSCGRVNFHILTTKCCWLCRTKPLVPTVPPLRTGIKWQKMWVAVSIWPYFRHLYIQLAVKTSRKVRLLLHCLLSWSLFFSEFSEFRKTSDQQCCCILYRFISQTEHLYAKRASIRRQKGLIKIFI